jgi:hypothetical protein
MILQASASLRTFIAGVLAIGICSLVSTHAAQAQNVYPGKWSGSWTVGLSLDSTDCDTEEIRFLKEELTGIVKIFGTRKTINRVRREYVKANGVGRSWETFEAKDITNRRFRALMSKSSAGALIKEKIIISNVRRKQGEVVFRGTVSYRGERCSYEYYGSISQS